MKEIARGAEAVIYRDRDMVVKERIAKGYRLREIDDRLRKSRTRREAKVYDKLKDLSFIPALETMDDKEMRLEIEYIAGKKLADHLEGLDWKKLCREIGRKIAELHNRHIIHGDLTTSNMILREKDGKVCLIDFGLSFFSHKIEDMAVDLHLIREALESKHHTIREQGFRELLRGYKEEAKEAEKVIARLEQVEARGRYKTKH